MRVSSSSSSVLVAAALSIVVAPSLVSGHGALMIPPPRNAVDRFLPQFQRGASPNTPCTCANGYGGTSRTKFCFMTLPRHSFTRRNENFQRLHTVLDFCCCFFCCCCRCFVVSQEKMPPRTGARKVFVQVVAVSRASGSHRYTLHLAWNPSTTLCISFILRHCLLCSSSGVLCHILIFSKGL